MKQLKFLETKRTPRYSLRKLNVGVASILLGVTIFGINFTNHSVKAATTESVESSNSSPNSNSQQTSAAVLTTDEQTKGINAIGAVKVPSLTDSQNDANKAIDDALNNKKSEINGATTIDQTTKDKLNQAATDAADKAKEAINKATTNNDVATEQTNTQKATSASNNATANNSTEAATTSSTKAKQTTQTATKNSDNTKVSSNTTNKENSQPTDKTTNTQVVSNIDKTLASLLTKLLATTSTTDNSASDISTLPKSDQTVTKVDPMMSDYLNRGGKNTWIDQTVASGWFGKDYAGKTETKIFGNDGIIKQNSDKYFFAGYVDFSEGYHRIILFARGQDAGDKNLYTYVVHTSSEYVQPQTEKPNETAPEIEYGGYGGFGGSTYNLQVHNYNGESFSVVLKGFKYDGQGGYGLTPIFDQGTLNPEYKDKTLAELDGTSGINYKEQIGSWDSVIPQEITTSVRYVDLETGKDIAQPLMVTGYRYQGVKINGNAPKIGGYTLVSGPKTLGLSYENGIIAPYKVGQTYTQYITDDVYVKQTVIDTNGTVRATAYYKGQPLGASASKILGHDDNNDSMSFTAGGQSYTYNNRINDVDGAMVYYYQKVGEEGKSQLRVHYIDVTKDTDDSQYAPGDGVPATNSISGQEMNPLTHTGIIGHTYDYATKAKAPEGYVLVGTSPNLKGTFSKSDHDAYIYVKIDRNGAKATIENLTHLNRAQKQAAEAAIDKATDLNTITQAKQDASTLDRAMGTLKQAITNGEATHGTVAYDEADLDKKSTLDNAIKNGQAVTDATNGSNADLTTVKDLSQAIENAQTGLNGDSNLAKAKDQADQNIAKLPNLSDGQKDIAKQNISNAQTTSDVQQAEQTAKTWNDNLGKLNQAISDANSAKSTPNYTEADSGQQKALDDALSEAEKAKNSNDPSAVGKATTDLQAAQSGLNGDSNLAKAKDQADQNIAKLPNLSDGQKDIAKQNISNAQTTSDVQQAEQTAKTWNDNLGKLNQAISDANSAKSTPNYTEADSGQQKALDDALSEAEKAKNSNDPSAVGKATTDLQAAQSGLNGDSNLAKAKDQADQNIAKLPNLSDGQKDIAKQNISNAQTTSDVQQAEQTAKTWNDNLGKLNQAISDANSAKSTPNYTEADSGQQKALDDALSEAEKAKNSNDPSAVGKATTDLQAAQSGLNGDSNLAKAKDQADQNIAKLPNLSDGQKDIAKQNISNAQTTSDVQQAEQTAKTWNDNLGKLNQAISDANSAKSTPNYTEADSGQQKALDDALSEAEKAKNSNDPSAVGKATTDLQAAQSGLNGDSNLAKAKDQADQNIAKLPNLSDGQKDIAKQNISNAQTTSDVQQAEQTAKTWNDNLGKLNQAISDANSAKSTPNYTEADSGQQKALDDALSEAEKAKNSNDPSAVGKATTDLQAAQSGLNGDSNLAKAKDQADQNIAKLPNLSDGQKDIAKQNISNAQTTSDVQQAEQTAKTWNDNLGKLNQAISDANSAKSTPNYTEADSGQQKALDDALSEAEKAKNSNDPSAVGKATTDLQAAQSGLNGDSNLAKAKDQADQNIAKLPNLSDGQKDIAKQNISNAQTTSDVQQAEQTAKTWNDNLGKLNQAISDANSAKSTPNYTEADSGQQKALDDALSEAEKAKNSNDPSAVGKATTDLQAAQSGLNGDSNLAKAKDQADQNIDDVAKAAKQAIDNTNGITDSEKQAAKGQVDADANAAKEAIANVDSTKAVTDAVNNGTVAINKDDANAAIDGALAEKNNSIEDAPNLTTEEKQAVKEQAKTDADNAKTAISNAKTVTDVESAKNTGVETINNIKVPTTSATKDAAINTINTALSDKKKAINGTNLTNEEKSTLVSQAQKLADDAIANINKATTNDAVKTAKENGVEKINNIKVPATSATKDAAKNAIDQAAKTKDDAIDASNLTAEEKDTLKQTVAGEVNKAKDAIDAATKDADVTTAKNTGVEKINNINVPTTSATKDAAINAINTALADKKAEINGTNLTAEEKTAVINKAQKLADAAIANINKATTNDAVNTAKENGVQAIKNMTIPTVSDVKKNAKNAIDQAAKQAIDNTNGLTDSEKQAAKSQVDTDAKAAKEDIDKADFNDAVTNAVNNGTVAINKDAANAAIDGALVKKNNSIDAAPNLTDEEKQSVKNQAQTVADSAKTDISKASTVAAVESAKNTGVDNINKVSIPAQSKAKAAAIAEIYAELNKKLDAINNNLVLVTEEKDALTNEANTAADKAKDAINKAASNADVESEEDKGITNIQNVDNPAKSQVKEADKAAVQAVADSKINAIDNAPNLTAEEKAELVKQVNDIASNAKVNIDNSSSSQSVETVRDNGISDIKAVEIPKSSKTKNDANSDLDKTADAAKQAIDKTSGLTADQKQTAKDQIEQAVTDAKENINNASDNKGVANATDAGKLAIDKVSAKAAIDAAVAAKKSKIAKTPLTAEESKLLNNLVDQEADAAKDAIDAATTNAVVEAAKNNGVETINNINVPATFATKDDANKAIADALAKKIEEINNANLTADQKPSLIDQAQNAANQAKENVRSASTDEDVQTAKNNGIAAINGITVKSNSVDDQDNSATNAGDSSQTGHIQKDKFPEGTTVTVGDDGTATVTYPDGFKDTIPGDQLVQGQKGDTTDAGNITPTIPGGKVTVKDPSHLTDDEKNQVKKNVGDANKGNFPAGTEITVGDDGTTTVTYPDGSKDTIPGRDLIIGAKVVNNKVVDANGNVLVGWKVVNGQAVKSSDQPVMTREAHKAQQAKTLPQTGEKDNKLGILGLLSVSLASLFGLGERKKKED